MILIDINMDGRNGVDICRKLKSEEATKNIPFLIFSSNYDITKVIKECGADGFLAKSFEQNQLKAKITDF